MSAGKFLNTAQAAEKYGMHPNTIRNAVQAREMTVFRGKKGTGHIRIAEEELERWFRATHKAVARRGDA